ncbi:MAG TPA: hypothetical protein DET40_23805 [Lentisphaeria bacterium]|nr:MAG: hypothetical protein A2X45_24020 [Lentisphaerae bacterium GWF2_50_93]HCE46583.1 hypothetical protein [Lentisphaeria bacterium]
MGSFEFTDGSVRMPETGVEFLEKILMMMEGGKDVLKIPRREEGDSICKGMHFHLEPEMFVQISGYTDFTFPKDRFRLMPGEVCVVPPKVGHSEKAGPFNGFPFFNLVVMPRGVRTFMHVANSAKGVPHTFKVSTYEAAVNTNRVTRYLEDLCDIVRESPDSQGLSASILESAVHLLLYMVRNTGKQEDLGKISHCKTIVAGLIANPSLNVKKISSLMKCSPDYLSHRFHLETGMKLTEYINHQRTDMAKELLESSMLSIKEISWACGYTDPGYLTRVFRKTQGLSPRGYRKKIS